MTSVQLRHIRIMAFIFCSAILGVVAVVGVQKSETFCNTSVITEDIYLKLGACVLYPNSNPYHQGRQFKMYFLFFRIIPLFRLRLFILYQEPHSRALAPACGALVSFFVVFVEDNVTMSSIPYFENRVRCFVQNRRKKTLVTLSVSIALKYIINYRMLK